MSTRHFLMIGVVGAVLLAGIFYYFTHARVDIVNNPPKNQTVVAFGDSLVSGQGSTKGNDFVSQLSTKLGRPILNLGVPGNTTRDGRVRTGEVLARDPGVVIVLLGGNDYLQKIPEAETFENLSVIIREFQKAGAMVVLLAVRGGVLRDGFENQFEDLADDMGVVYVPDVLHGLIGNSSLMADLVHPNDAGYALIAEKVYTEMVRYLK